MAIANIDNFSLMEFFNLLYNKIDNPEGLNTAEFDD
jgi:hypothetical protein